MTTKELQLDDYVIVHDDGENVVVRVTAMNRDTLSVFDAHGPFTVPISIVKPLVLTEEILKKNFPEYEEGYEIGWWKEDNGKGFHIEYTDAIHAVVMRYVQYAHELQHIMRVCNFHKDLEA